MRDWLCSRTVRELHDSNTRGVAAYLNLLCEAWLETPQGTLPVDHDKLARLARVSRQEFDEIWKIIACQFECTPDGRIGNMKMLRHKEISDLRRISGGTRPSKLPSKL